MSDVFISYAREDLETARALATVFARQDWSVWWDRNIPKGKVFDEVIEQEIDSAKVVIVLWSQNSVQSSWVRAEAEEGAGRGILMPVLAEDVKPPLRFRQIQAANLTGWDGASPHPELTGLLTDASVLVGKPLLRPPTEEKEEDEGATVVDSGEGGGGRLRLRLLDVYGDSLGDELSLAFKKRDKGETKRLPRLDASKPIVITNLYAAPSGIYRLDIRPDSYYRAVKVVNVRTRETADVEVVLPIRPGKVSRVSFPFYDDLPEDLRRLFDATTPVTNIDGMSGKDLYTALDDAQRANLLNVAAKLQATDFAPDDMLKYFRELVELRDTHFFAFVKRGLFEAAVNAVAAGGLREVSGALHRPPERLHKFEGAGSFKTLETYGSMQLTFFSDGENYLIDADLDDGMWLSHISQERPGIIGEESFHPYVLHEILVAEQRIDPGYRLLP